MIPASVPVNGFEQEISVSVDVMADFKTGSLVFGGSMRMEHQHVSRLQNTIQVEVPQGAVTTRITTTVMLQAYEVLSYQQQYQQGKRGFTQGMEHPTLREFLTRLHHRTPVIPKTSSADLIRELRDEP
jgi:endonuclease I